MQRRRRWVGFFAPPESPPRRAPPSRGCSPPLCSFLFCPPPPWADSPQGPVQFEYSYFIERTERPPCPSQAHRILIHGATAWRQVGLHAAAQKIDHLRFPREPVAASPAQVRHQELRCLQGPRCRKKQELGQRLYKHNCGGESLAGAAPYQTGSGSTRRTAPWGGDAGFIT